MRSNNSLDAGMSCLAGHEGKCQEDFNLVDFCFENCSISLDQDCCRVRA
jgi:hypothetical protein